jgi:hypothetical protein
MRISSTMRLSAPKRHALPNDVDMLIAVVVVALEKHSYTTKKWAHGI